MSPEELRVIRQAQEAQAKSAEDSGRIAMVATVFVALLLGWTVWELL